MVAKLGTSPPYMFPKPETDENRAYWLHGSRQDSQLDLESVRIQPFKPFKYCHLVGGYFIKSRAS
jgi:hypothetical protein